MAEIVSINSAADRAMLAGASCAFGVFDGVHRGHRFLIDEAICSAREIGGPSVALTFDIDPDELFHADALFKLLSNPERLDALASTGVDTVAVLRFDRGFASLLPGEFLRETFAGNLPACIHVGRDIRFGYKAAGTIDDMRNWGIRNDVDVIAHDLLEEDGAPITATRIRQLIESGNERRAAQLLGW